MRIWTVGMIALWGMLRPAAVSAEYTIPLYRYHIPRQPPVRFTPVARIDFNPVEECSGIVASRQFPGIFWVHNDSGDWPRLFAIDGQGRVVKPEASVNYRGLLVQRAEHFDWEAIALDAADRIVIADVGNNANRRRNLRIYLVPEEDPRRTEKLTAVQSWTVYYPEQKEFPPIRMNYDCEAVFTAYGNIYLLTKHRSNAQSVLYRFRPPAQPTQAPQPLERVAAFVAGGMVTAADCSPDGRRLLILTYDAIWGFEQTDGSDQWFAGKARYLLTSGIQGEAICWENAWSILVANENRQIFRLDWESLPPVLLSERTEYPRQEDK